MFRVVDCEFNRRWYPTLIGRDFDSAPAYAAVVRIPDEGFGGAGGPGADLIGYLVVRSVYDVGHRAVCLSPKCGASVREIRSPLFRENVGGYQQTCCVCGKKLNDGQMGWPELFDGK